MSYNIGPSIKALFKVVQIGDVLIHLNCNISFSTNFQPTVPFDCKPGGIEIETEQSFVLQYYVFNTLHDMIFETIPFILKHTNIKT